MDNHHRLNTDHVRRRFERAAAGFDAADFVHARTRDGLFARLEPMVVDASVVVDLGCATGAAIRPLERRFRGARVVGVDVSGAMLEHCRARGGWFSRATAVQADARALPFAAHSIDVVFCNMLLPWIDEPATLLQGVARILTGNGLLVFATLGPDSLSELAGAWGTVDDTPHVNRFPDMHDLGDALVRASLRDPVLDVDRQTVSWPDSSALFRDLTAAGARNALAGRRRSLTGPARFRGMREALDRGSDIRLDLEIIYGHCWGPGAERAAGDVRIDAGAIPVRQRAP